MSQLNLEFPLWIENEAAMEALGVTLSESVQLGTVLFLKGDLGAGKTTLIRGFLKGLGYKGIVKSPTYTLVEEYCIGDRRVYHFDLYRISDPESLEFLGIREYFKRDAIILIEWPERGAGFLPVPDILLEIEILDEGRRVSIR